jgi:hypothetical protein
MLDSPEGVCPGQVRFEYPATFVLFSNSGPPRWFSRALSSALTLVTIGTIVAAEAVTLRILYTGRATPTEQAVIVWALFLAGFGLIAPVLLEQANSFIGFLPGRYKGAGATSISLALLIGFLALLAYLFAT